MLKALIKHASWHYLVLSGTKIKKKRNSCPILIGLLALYIIAKLVDGFRTILQHLSLFAIQAMPGCILAWHRSCFNISLLISIFFTKYNCSMHRTMIFC